MSKLGQRIKEQYHELKGHAKWELIKWMAGGGVVSMALAIWNWASHSILSEYASLAAFAVGLLMLLVAIIGFFMRQPKAQQQKAESPDANIDKIPPNLVGIWVKRKTGGTLELEQEGIKIWGTYSEGGWEQAIKGFFNPKGRKFEVKTTRVDTTAKEGRFIQNETFVLLDENTLFFHCMKDYYGKEDAGILIRRGWRIYRNFLNDKIIPPSEG